MCSILLRIWRSRKAPREELPLIEDGHWNRLLKCDGELLVALNLAKGAFVKTGAPKKRGRPRKEQKAAELGAGTPTPKRPGRPRVRPIIYGPPRPRGRPRK